MATPRTRGLVGAFVAAVLLVALTTPGLAWIQRKVATAPATYVSFTVTALSCTDKTSHTLQDNTVQVEVWNTNEARDVCLAWSGDPDHTDLTTCDVVLGAYAGSGSSQIYQSPPTLGLGGLAIKCDAAGASVLRVTEFVGPGP